MHKLPEAFIQEFRNKYGSDTYERYLQSFSQGLNSIRIHSDKCGNLNLESLPKVPWCQNGYYLAERPNYTWDPGFQSGYYYPQEAGSMSIELAFNQWRKNYHSDSIVGLDACAAPGGKSTHLLNLLSEENDVLICNEPIPKRNRILQQNIGKWGLANFAVCAIDFENKKLFEDSCFDFVVVDAPCSGEGMFRKDLNAIDEWNEQAPQHCAIRQKNILSKLLPLIKPGGLLIYSTCTFNALENESHREEIISHGFTPMQLKHEISWGLTAVNEALQFIPGSSLSEGFYLSAFEKDGEALGSANLLKSKKSEVKLPELDAKEFITLSEKKNRVFAATQALLNFLEDTAINFTKCGLELGEIKGKNLFIPSSELAWAVSVRSPAPHYALNSNEYAAFLRGESWTNKDLEPGIYQLSIMDFPLGFAKAVKGRWNNLREKYHRVISPMPENFSEEEIFLKARK